MTGKTGHIWSVIVAVGAMALAGGCGDSNVETVNRDQTAAAPQQRSAPDAAQPSVGAGQPASEGQTSSAAGITWSIPAGWETGPERQMRAATYIVRHEGQEADCAVFYFGPGQGGGIQSNIDRWIGQFTQPDGSESRNAAKIASHSIANMNVTTIDLSGTYTASMGGPMSAQKENRSGYRMLGAIIEAPGGPVFFKLTGPESVVVNSLDAFQRLVESVKPQ